MQNEHELERLQAKTPQRRFLGVLEREFHYAPKVAEAILEEAESCLAGGTEKLRPGQVRVVLVRQGSGGSQPLSQTPTLEVTWTVDAGAEDRQVQAKHGQQALRQVRLQRLLDEAVEQGGVATQEDLAQALHTSVRTIKRDFVDLQERGAYLPSRGNLQGIGRGQTHKAQIIGRWLQGETYDQLALHTHHCSASIQRYIKTFVQVVELHRQGFAENQIALLLQSGLPLVREYLAIYQQQASPACRERLENQLQRLNRASAPEKRGQK
jgi:predicted ArsR family transcriptional regulator